MGRKEKQRKEGFAEPGSGVGCPLCGFKQFASLRGMRECGSCSHLYPDPNATGVEGGSDPRPASGGELFEEELAKRAQAEAEVDTLFRGSMSEELRSTNPYYRSQEASLQGLQHKWLKAMSGKHNVATEESRAWKDPTALGQKIKTPPEVPPASTELDDDDLDVDLDHDLEVIMSGAPVSQINPMARPPVTPLAPPSLGSSITPPPMVPLSTAPLVPQSQPDPLQVTTHLSSAAGQFQLQVGLRNLGSQPLGSIQVQPGVSVSTITFDQPLKILPALAAGAEDTIVFLVNRGSATGEVAFGVSVKWLEGADPTLHAKNSNPIQAFFS